MSCTIRSLEVIYFNRAFFPSYHSDHGFEGAKGVDGDERGNRLGDAEGDEKWGAGAAGEEKLPRARREHGQLPGERELQVPGEGEERVCVEGERGGMDVSAI